MCVCVRAVSSVAIQDNVSLALGSVIACELREALFSRLSLTSCAGVANSKLLAKLVSRTFKPNQQTTLLPQSVSQLMSSLNGTSGVPGNSTSSHTSCYVIAPVSKYTHTVLTL